MKSVWSHWWPMVTCPYRELVVLHRMLAIFIYEMFYVWDTVYTCVLLCRWTFCFEKRIGQAQQLIVLAVFGAVDEPLAYGMMVHLCVYVFKWHLVFLWYSGGEFSIDIFPLFMFFLYITHAHTRANVCVYVYISSLSLYIYIYNAIQ